jgi:adenylate cyclase
VSRIFVSYAREDVDTARQLADGIAEAGHEVWWDSHLAGGARFANEIDQALKDAEAVVVLWSGSSINSAWVLDEAAEGRDSGRLVPVAIESAKPPLGFRQFHTIDLGPSSDRRRSGAFDELLDAIAKKCGSKPIPRQALPAARAKAQETVSICVLPFANMSGDPEQEYFSDGISEDITTDLSKFSALDVVARNTAFGFKGQNPDVKQVARQLGVSHVLEGSVRKAGSRVRITAQLIDGRTGNHLWADRFDRDLTDIFEIQDEISHAIVAALKVQLLPKDKVAIEGRGTANVDAYSLYLMARQQWISGGFSYRDSHKMIVRLCREATSLDPDYAQAWALMALAQAALRFWYGNEEDALPAAERALALNPKLPEAHCVKARYLEDEGLFDQAERQIRIALDLSPASWEANRELASFLYRHARISDAIPFFDKAASMMETDTSSAAMLLSCYQAIGDREKVREAAQLCVARAERAIAHDPSHAVELAWGTTALAALGEGDRARDWARRALIIDPDNTSMRYNLACSFSIGLGDPEAALDILGPYFERVDAKAQLRHLEADPDFEPIRDNPRFKEMLAAARQRLGMEGAASELRRVLTSDPPPGAVGE